MGRESDREIQKAEQAIAEFYGIHLEAGEHLCDKCGGRGIYPLSETYEKERCDKCWGEKKLDWIERAMGKQDPCAGMSASSSSSSLSSSQANSTSIRASITQKKPKTNLDILDEVVRSMEVRQKKWVNYFHRGNKI